jgi:outer membrane protein assembly factor BamB
VDIESAPGGGTPRGGPDRDPVGAEGHGDAAPSPPAAPPNPAPGSSIGSPPHQDPTGQTPKHDARGGGDRAAEAQRHAAPADRTEGPAAIPRSAGAPPARGGVGRWVVAWVVALVVVAGLLVPLVLATQRAARPASADLERYVPSEPGSTWVYDTATNGKDTDRLVEQISGPALVEISEPDSFVVTDHWANFIGSGAPRTVLSYYGLKGSREVRFGERSDNQFQQATPPEVALQLPLDRGSRWTWRGKRQGGTGTSTTTVLHVADRHVLGRTFPDCLLVRATSHDTGSQGNTSTDVLDTWRCPEIGATLVHEVFRSGSQTIRYDATLTEVHVPGINLGGRPPALASTRLPAGGTGAVDAGHSGFVAGARPSTDHLAWTIARRGEVLYPPVGSGDDVILAEDDGTVSSTNVRTGAVNWQVGLAGPIVASPVVAGRLVLVADAHKALWALDASDGTTRWVIDLPDVVSATPAVAGQTIVLPTDDLTVRGIDLATGAQGWTSTSIALVVSPPVVAAGLVVVGDQVGNVTAFHPDDGSVAWTDSSILTFSGGTTELGGLAAGGDTVVASTDGSAVFAYDAATGLVRWRAQSSSTVDRPVSVAGDRVVVASDSSVEVHDGRSGRLLWRRHTDTTFAPPMVLGDTVAVLQTNSHLLLFDLGTGMERTVSISAPGAASDQDTKLPMAWAAGSLVVPTHDLGSWPSTILQAFPAGTGVIRDGAGVRPAGEPYVFGSVPLGPATLVGRTLYVIGTAASGDSNVDQLYEVRPRAAVRSSSRVLYRSTASLAFALAAGDRVVTQAGTRILGVPVSGGHPWVARGAQLLPGTQPIVAGGTVLVPDTQSGLSGLDARTGRQAWPQIPLPGAGGLGSPVELTDGDVAWGVGGITVLDPATGKVEAQRRGVASTATLAQDADRLFGLVTVGKKNLIAGFDATTLDPQWARPFTPAALFGLISLAPAAGDGVVAAVDSGSVIHGFAEATGRELWSVPLRMMPNTPPVVWQGRVYVEEPGLSENLDQHEHRVTVLDARTGAFEGQWEPAGVSFFAGAFGLAGDRLVIPVSNGVLAVRPEGR